MLHITDIVFRFAVTFPKHNSLKDFSRKLIKEFHVTAIVFLVLEMYGLDLLFQTIIVLVVS